VLRRWLTGFFLLWLALTSQLAGRQDNLNRLTVLTDEESSVPTRPTYYGYDLGGNRVFEKLPNNEVTATDFDALNRPVEAGTVTAAGKWIYDQQTARDQAGNVVRLREDVFTAAIPPRTTTNTYDGASRLLTETSVQDITTRATTYTYDAGNNRSSRVVVTTPAGGSSTTVTTSYAVNNLNQLTSYSDGSNTTTLSYDAAGNRHTRIFNGVTDTYSYDCEHRLTSLNKGSTGGTGTYAYDYDYRTRRVERDETPSGGSTSTTSVVFSGGTSVQEYNGTTLTASALAAQFIRGSDWGGGVGGLLYSVRGTTPSYKHYDSRGDIVVETNTSSSATWAGAYEAFGTFTEQTGMASADRQKANTKEEDPTGLLNEGFRYRDLDAGVFLTRDPAGFVDGPNLYAYCVQNPWSKFDPEGLFMWTNLDAGQWFGAVLSGAGSGAAGYAQGLAVSPISLVQTVGNGYGQIGTMAGEIATGTTGIGGMASHPAETAAAAGGVALQTGKQALNALQDPETLGKTVGAGLILGGAVAAAAPEAAGAGTAATEEAAAANAGSKAAAGGTPPGAESATVTLYRGVNESHVAYEDAQAGVVRPNGGTATPLEHNTVPGATLNSPYTSWTTNPAVARNFATRPSGQGVVIKAEVPVSQTVPSPGSFEVKLPGGSVVPENEVLVTGTVKGTPTPTGAQ